MKLARILFLLLFIPFISIESSNGMTNYEISKICKFRKKEKKNECIDRLMKNRYYLNQGKPIEIKVFPYSK
tara:strand:- start:57 stop:269 length:213 start_codon:yes stop_codon:yes gene_type:complete